MTTDPTFWIEARASGLAAYMLVTASMLAGLVLKSRPFGTRLKPAAVTEIHRSLAVFALTATVIHGIALVLDSSVSITLTALVVPGLVPYRPVWTSIGVLTAELMLLVYLSFPLRRLIGSRTWRKLHWSTYGVFAGATVHGVMSGTDTGRPWVSGVYLGAIGAVAFATCWRIAVPPPRPARPSRTAVERAGA